MGLLGWFPSHLEFSLDQEVSKSSVYAQSALLSERCWLLSMCRLHFSHIVIIASHHRVDYRDYRVDGMAPLHVWEPRYLLLSEFHTEMQTCVQISLQQEGFRVTLDGCSQSS